MDGAKLRAWWWHRQGLGGALAGRGPAEILEQSGWAGVDVLQKYSPMAGTKPWIARFTAARQGSR
jgi:hypothetical protein